MGLSKEDLESSKDMDIGNVNKEEDGDWEHWEGDWNYPCDIGALSKGKGQGMSWKGKGWTKGEGSIAPPCHES